MNSVFKVDFIKEGVYFIRHLLWRESFKYDKARLLNHTVLEVLFYRGDVLWSTVVTGDYKDTYKEHGKEDLPRSLFDSVEADHVIRKYKRNWVKK
jgi:hypothetical protein